MLSIYEYTSYKDFLRDYYNEKKSELSHFSYQFLADNCGFKSKTYIYKVIKGEKALTLKSALKIGTFMKLKKKEMDYFEAIVMFTNSKSVDEKDFYFKKLQNFCKGCESQLLRQYQFEYFNHWYNIAIREIAPMINWMDDYVVLAKAVTPHITAKEAQKSIALLLKIGLLERDEEGRYHQTDRAITTGADVTSHAVNRFQRENLHLAAEAIDRFPRDKRDISTLTVSISESGADRIKKEIALFRKRLVEIVAEDEPVDRVYQINFQAFPLSSIQKEKR